MKAKGNIPSIFLAIIFCLLSFSLKTNISFELSSSVKTSLNTYFEITRSSVLLRAESIKEKRISKNDSFQLVLFFIPVKDDHYYLSKFEQRNQIPTHFNQTLGLSLKEARAPPIVYS